jgi:hypothetical protein
MSNKCQAPSENQSQLPKYLDKTKTLSISSNQICSYWKRYGVYSLLSVHIIVIDFNMFQEVIGTLRKEK